MGQGATRGMAEEVKTHLASPIATTTSTRITKATTVPTTIKLAKVDITVAANNSIREVEVVMPSITITRMAIAIISKVINIITNKTVVRVVKEATIRGATLVPAQP